MRKERLVQLQMLSARSTEDLSQFS